MKLSVLIKDMFKNNLFFSLFILTSIAVNTELRDTEMHNYNRTLCKVL